MAETKETVIVSIEIEKGDNEKQVDNLTKKIVGLTSATKDLKKENDKLAAAGQANSAQYLENTRQIEINKQKINEATSSRKNLIQTLIAEDNSIKALQIRNAELIKQRNQLNLNTEEGRQKIAEINKELDKNNITIRENVSNLEKQKINIGNYKSALDGVVPGLGAMVDGIEKSTAAAKVFIATPLGAILGAIGLALGALMAYFKGSEEGQNRLNKITSIGSAILEQFMNVVEDLGEAIFNAFTNPKQAIIDLWELIKENIVNRIVGLFELFPKLGKSLELLFEGNFAESAKVAADAILKVATGIENATDKIAGFIEGTSKLVDEGIRNGERLAALNAKIDTDERKLIVDRAKTALEVAKLREEALQVDGEARKKVLLEAIALEEDIAAREVELARTRLAEAELRLKAEGDDKAALKAVAEARAAVIEAETTAFGNTLRFRKQIASLDEEERRAREKAAEEDKKIKDDQLDAELERQEKIREALIATEELRLEQEILKATSLEERVAKEIELEAFKASTLLQQTALSEEEQNLIIAQARANRNAIIKKADDERVKQEKDREKALALEKKKIQDQDIQGRRAATDAAIAFASELFGKNKAVATAEVIVNTIRAVTRAYADYQFPFSLIVSALMGGLGALQIAKINGVKFARGGMLRNISKRGGVARGPLHAQGGIPGVVGPDKSPIEFEGGETIINRKSSRMYRKELSAINRAGGGVEFASGGIAGSSTRQASVQAESRTAVRDAVQSVMDNMPPIIVTVEDINARSEEVSSQSQKANVI